jgi:replicative DNA helicase
LTEVEAALVGLCIRRGELALPRALAAGLSPTHFGDPVLREIFCAILAAEKEGRPYDLPALGLHCRQHVMKLVDLHENAPVSMETEYLVEEIVRAHLRRQLQRSVDDLRLTLHSQKPFEPLDVVQAQIAALDVEAKGASEKSLLPRPSVEVINELTLEIERRIRENLDGTPIGIPTGIKLLDRYTSGLVPRRYYVIAARTSMGKTAFALNLALSAAKAGSPVSIFTVEMSAQSLMKRLIACEAGIKTRKLDSGDLTEEELDRYSDAARKLSALKIGIQDKTERTFERVKVACEVLKRRGELGLVVIDYIQQFKLESERISSSYERVTRVSAEIQALAEKLEVPFLVVAQMNREAAKETPGIHHIKESGAIEQDADVIMILYEDGKQPKLAIAKNRHGLVREFPIVQDFDKGRFLNANVNEAAYDDL